MTTNRRCPARRAILALALGLLGFGAFGGALAAGAEQTAGPTRPLPALLGDVDAILEGVVSGSAASNQPGPHPVVVYNLLYPVVVFERDGVLPPVSEESGARSIEVRIDNRGAPAGSATGPGWTLMPGSQSLLFVKKRDGVLVVTAALRIEDHRVVPHPPGSEFAAASAGMKVSEFIEKRLLRPLFLQSRLAGGELPETP